MAEESWPFFPGGTGVGETEWSRMARLWACSGVVGDPTGLPLQVYADGSGMQVFLRPGSAWVRGHFYRNTETITIPVDTNGSGSVRTDRVVLRLDPGEDEIVPELVEGTPGAGPPDLTQTDTGVFQLPLSQVPVDPPATNIAATKPVNERVGVSAGVHPVLTLGQILAPTPGHLAYEISTGRMRQWNGAQWVQPWAVDLGSAVSFGPLAQATTASTEWVTGGPQGTFTAPASGKVFVKLSAFLNNNGIALTLFGFELYNGPAVTPTALRIPANGARALIVGGGARMRATHDVLVEGLTPGAQYTVLGCRSVTGGIGTYDYRQIAVQPTT